jgi:uncharacterized membrane protein HdeD (DUF308 family)
LKQQNPLLLCVVGVFFIIFGVIDIIFLNKIIGLALTVAGVAFGVNGLRHWQKLKR